MPSFSCRWCTAPTSWTVTARRSSTEPKWACRVTGDWTISANVDFGFSNVIVHHHQSTAADRFFRSSASFTIESERARNCALTRRMRFACAPMRAIRNSFNSALPRRISFSSRAGPLPFDGPNGLQTRRITGPQPLSWVLQVSLRELLATSFPDFPRSSWTALEKLPRVAAKSTLLRAAVRKSFVEPPGASAAIFCCVFPDTGSKPLSPDRALCTTALTLVVKSFICASKEAVRSLVESGLPPCHAMGCALPPYRSTICDQGHGQTNTQIDNHSAVFCRFRSDVSGAEFSGVFRNFLVFGIFWY